MDLTGRTALNQIVALIMHLPSYLKADIDADVFLSSISYMSNGVRRRLKPWKFAPGSLYRHGDYDNPDVPDPRAVADRSILWAHRIAAQEKMDARRKRYKSAIPSFNVTAAQYKKMLRELAAEDEGQ